MIPLSLSNPAVADRLSAGAGATDPAPPSVAPATITITASYRPPILSGRPSIIIVRCRSEQSVTPSHAAPAQPNTRTQRSAGNSCVGFRNASDARGERRVLRWSARAVLTPLASRICSAYRTMLGGLVDNGANALTDWFEGVIQVPAVVVHRRQLTGAFLSWVTSLMSRVTKCL